MDINDKLVAAVTPVVSICRAGTYRHQTGEAIPSEYCTYNYFDAFRVFADGRPKKKVRSFQLHYVSTAFKDPEPMKAALEDAVISAGFQASGWTDASDKESATHWVLEFEGIV